MTPRQSAAVVVIVGNSLFAAYLLVVPSVGASPVWTAALGALDAIGLGSIRVLGAALLASAVLLLIGLGVDIWFAWGGALAGVGVWSLIGASWAFAAVDLGLLGAGGVVLIGFALAWHWAVLRAPRRPVLT